MGFDLAHWFRMARLCAAERLHPEARPVRSSSLCLPGIEASVTVLAGR
jgi:hypothetical protein